MVVFASIPPILLMRIRGMRKAASVFKELEA
jgi:hypothetical protein